MPKRHDTVHVGERLQRIAVEGGGDMLRDRCRAVDGGNDADVIARRNAAIRAPNPQKGPRLRNRRNRLKRRTNRVVAVKFPHFEVVHVNVLPLADRLAGKTNDLGVAAHRIPGVQ